MKGNPFKTVRSLWHTVIPGLDPESKKHYFVNKAFFILDSGSKPGMTVCHRLLTVLNGAICF